MYVDAYLLGIVFVYFKRAKLTYEQFNRANFFGALWVKNKQGNQFQTSSLLSVKINQSFVDTDWKKLFSIIMYANWNEVI